jgi:Zn-dependent protease
MPEFTLLQKIILWLVPTIFAITLHEVAHGFVAYRLGDPTAKVLGRLTLNPLKHIDLFGTIIIPIILFKLGGFIFGWAKPVPVDYRNLRKTRRDSVLVAIAGPLANLLMAVLWALIAKLGFILRNDDVIWGVVLIYMGMIGIAINTVLMILNLIPIPPLDGSRVLSAMLSPRASMQYNRIEPFGFLILVILLASGLLNQFMSPLVSGLQTLLVQNIVKM